MVPARMVLLKEQNHAGFFVSTERIAMGVQLGSAFGAIRLDASGVQLGVQQALNSTQTLQRSMEQMGATLVRTGALMSAGLTLPLVAAGKAIFDLTANFDTAMRNVNSIAKLPEAAFQQLEQQVLSLSRVFPQTAEVLAKGLYDIQSSGFVAADAMKILEVAAKGASAGLTTTDVSARALTAILNAYSLEVSDADHVMDVLFKTVDRGVLTFEELANNIGNVAGTANIAKVSIEEVGAAFAVMTKGGISAAEAETALNQVMLSLISPSKEAAAAAQALGIDFSASALASKGLAGVMEEVRIKTGGSAEAMAALFPNVRALKGALALTREEGKAFTAELEAMAQASGATNAAFAEQSKGVAFQMKILQNNVEALAISFGSALLPVINDVFGFVRSTVLPALERLVQWFQALPPDVQKAALAFAAVVAIAGPVIAALGAIVTLVGFLLSPIGLLVLAVAGLAAAWQTNFLGIRDSLLQAWSIIGPVLLNVVAQIGNLFDLIVSGEDDLNAYWEIFESVFGPQAATLLTALVGGIQTIVAAVGDFIRVLQKTGDPVMAIAAVLARLFGPELAGKFAVFAAQAQEFFLGLVMGLQQVAAAVAPSLGAIVAFIQDGILPGLQMLVTWFLNDGLPAFLLFGSQIVAALMPALFGLQNMFSALLPILGQIGFLLSSVLIAVLPILAQIINAIVIPVLQVLWQIVETLVLPVLGALAQLIGSVLNVALNLMGAVLRNVIAPILKAISDHVLNEMIPSLQGWVDLISSKVGPVLDWFIRTILQPMQAAFGAIVDLLESLSDWLNIVAEQLANLQLPEWLQRHSPSPFEQTLMNAVELLRQMRGVLPTSLGGMEGMRAPGGVFAGMGAGGGGGGGRSVIMQPIVNFNGAVIRERSDLVKVREMLDEWWSERARALEDSEG